MIFIFNRMIFILKLI